MLYDHRREAKDFSVGIVAHSLVEYVVTRVCCRVCCIFKVKGTKEYAMIAIYIFMVMMSLRMKMIHG